MQRTRIISVDPASTVVASSGKLGRMPKATDPELLARAAVLLAGGMSARAVARQVMREFPGRSISHTRVAELAPAINVELAPGRTVGIPQPRPATSERRQLAREMVLYEDPTLSYDEIGQVLGCSKARAHQLATDGK